MEKPTHIYVLHFLYSQSLSQENDGSCYTYNGTINLHWHLAICENSPFNCLLYAKLKVITLYSYEHKGNYAPTKCIGSHFNKISTLLVVLVHSYRIETKMGVNWLKRSSPAKQTNGGGPLRLAR